jgi:hypothetical protein
MSLRVSKPSFDMHERATTASGRRNSAFNSRFRNTERLDHDHILRRELDFPGPVGTLFNKAWAIIWKHPEGQCTVFLGKMQNCEGELQRP